MFSNKIPIHTQVIKKSMAIALLTSVGAVTAQAQWTMLGSNTNGISPSYSSFQNIAKDTSGNLYVSFYDLDVTKGSVMKYNGTSWSYLGAAGITSGTATYSGLAVARNGDVFYCNQAAYPASGVEVRKFSNNSWSLMTTLGTTVANFQAMATTSNNHPIVAYSTNGRPNVKRFDGTSWLDVGVGLPTEVPYYLDLKVANDTAYVAWTGTTGVKVYKIYAYALGLSSWQEVGTTGFTATATEQFRSALAVDASNNVYVAFTSTASSGNRINVKKYAVNTGTWSDVGAPNFSTHKVHYVSIAVSSTGVPFVAYSHFEAVPNNKNYVMKFNGTMWESVGTGAISDGMAKWNDIILDKNDKPVVAYSDEDNMTSGNMVKRFESAVNSCNNTIPGNTPGSLGCVTFNYRGVPVTYTTVRGSDGNVWLQQNLGSARIGTSKTDTAAYGDMFQWGRWDDGHQSRTSATGSVPNPNDPTGIGTGSATFYTGTGTGAWWNGGALTNTWSAPTNTQVTATDGCDPCKALGNGWHLPTETDWAGVVTAEQMTNTNTAFSSNLKLVVGGSRSYTNGNYDFVGVRGYYWSSTPSSSGAKNLYYSDFIVNASAGNPRGGGASVRCMYTPIINATSIDVQTQNNAAASITTFRGTLQMESVILPATANQAVTWSIVPGSGTATISATGLVAALSDGTVYAKATAVSNPTLVDSLLITLSNQDTTARTLTVVTQNNVTPAITTNNGTLQVEAIILPAIATQTVTWSIVNGSGSATINSNGLITAQANGDVWAKAVSVANPALVDSLLINISNQAIAANRILVVTENNVPASIANRGGTLNMDVVITPANATNKDVTWSIVPGTGTASINANGVVTAQTNGTVYARAELVSDAAIYDSLMVVISNQGGLSVGELENGMSFVLHPNPTQHQFQVVLPSMSASTSLSIISIDGKIVHHQKIVQTKTTIDVAALVAGIYLVKITSDDGYAVKKLIIQK